MSLHKKFDVSDFKNIFGISMSDVSERIGKTKESDTVGHSWDTPSRRRNTQSPTCNKQRFAMVLNIEPFEEEEDD